MTVPPELAARYAPGEDVRPVARALAGGLGGAAVALALDRAAVPFGYQTWTWPALLGGALLGDASAIPAGIALLVALACVASLLFVYGQGRRFVPGPGWLRGAAWGAMAWLLAAPALVPAAAGWVDQASGNVPAALIGSLVVVGETALGAVACGAVIGAVNPPRP